MPTRYTRFGEFFMRGIAAKLTQGTTIDVPNVGRCSVLAQIEPRMNSSQWSMEVDIGFPDSHSQMSIMLCTIGSCLGEDTERIALPDASYEDKADETYPKEHQDAWFTLLGDLETALEAKEYKVGSSDTDDFFIITDYYPSKGISTSILKPSSLTNELVQLCHDLLQQHSGKHFWIQLNLELSDNRHKGHQENILVREDRVVYDLDFKRLRSEFGIEFELTPEI